MLRFRCRVGHAYSAESLASEQADNLEASLWAALRALEENTGLNRRLAERAVQRDDKRMETRYAEEAIASQQHARILRNLLMKNEENAS